MTAKKKSKRRARPSASANDSRMEGEAGAAWRSPLRPPVEFELITEVPAGDGSLRGLYDTREFDPGVGFATQSLDDIEAKLREIAPSEAEWEKGRMEFDGKQLDAFQALRALVWIRKLTELTEETAVYLLNVGRLLKRIELRPHESATRKGQKAIVTDKQRGRTRRETTQENYAEIRKHYQGLIEAGVSVEDAYAKTRQGFRDKKRQPISKSTLDRALGLKS